MGETVNTVNLAVFDRIKFQRKSIRILVIHIVHIILLYLQAFACTSINLGPGQEGRGGFRGGGGDLKGPPFDTFSEIHFWPTDPKIFIKAPLAPIYTNFEGERAPKKNAIFFVKIFQKVPKNGIFDCFLKKIGLRRTKFRQDRGKTVLWESSKNQFGWPKKKGRQNFGKFFEIPPPLEKILDPPLKGDTTFFAE